MKALVVDDSRAMRTILTQSLKEAGFTEVSQAANGREGYEHLKGHPDTQLALVDWNMPEMTGIQMVEAVRKEGGLSAVRIMMVTTETEVAHMQQAIEAAANEYVMKPFTKDVIAEKLRGLGF